MELSGECPWCGEASLFHYDRYDAKCCLSCDVWLDKACGDPRCPYCATRPKTPSEAFFLEEDKDFYKKERLRKNYQHKNDGRLHHKRIQEQNTGRNERAERNKSASVYQDSADNR